MQMTTIADVDLWETERWRAYKSTMCFVEEFLLIQIHFFFVYYPL
jgi:hypothetical protein